MNTVTTKTIWSLSALLMFASLSARAQPVNSQVTDAVSQTNVRVLGQGPNMLAESPNAPGATIAIKNNTQKTAWMTIYNTFGSIRDSGCVQPGQEIQFHNYYGPLAYKVRAEVTAAAGCAGAIIADISTAGGVSINAGLDVSIEQGASGSYYLEKHKFAGAPEAAADKVSAPSATIRTKDNTNYSMWITVYNYFGSIRDSGCVKPGDVRDWTNYWGPLGFKVRAEVTKNLDCGGDKLADLSVWISVDPLSGRDLSLEQRKDGSFFWNK